MVIFFPLNTQCLVLRGLREHRSQQRMICCTGVLSLVLFGVTHHSDRVVLTLLRINTGPTKQCVHALGFSSTPTGRNLADSLAPVKCVPQPISQSCFSREDNGKVKPTTPRSPTFSFAGVCHSWRKAHTHRNNCHPNSAPQGLGARGLLALSESVMNSSFSVAFRPIIRF